MKRLSLKGLGLFLMILSAQNVHAQSYVGVSYNVFLESFSKGNSPAFDFMTENVNSLSIRYARKNMFSEIRWQQFNVGDNPKWADSGRISFDSTLNQYVI